jgi:hypothetical protein
MHCLLHEQAGVRGDLCNWVGWFVGLWGRAYEVEALILSVI